MKFKYIMIGLLMVLLICVISPVSAQEKKADPGNRKKNWLRLTKKQQ